MLHRGEQEVLKGAIHAHMASLLATMTLYNLGACAERRDRRLGLQAALYAGLCLFEWRQVYRHWHG